MEMKFDKLKEKAKEVIINRYQFSCSAELVAGPFNAFQALIISLDNKQPWRDNLEEMKEWGCDIIDKWDVRRIKTLIELFPSIIPKKYLTRPITVYMADNENCDWMVSFS